MQNEKNNTNKMNQQNECEQVTNTKELKSNNSNNKEKIERNKCSSFQNQESKVARQGASQQGEYQHTNVEDKNKR